MSKYKKPPPTFPISKFQDAGYVQPPIVFQNISTGQRNTRSYEAQTSIPIDGSDSFARSLSPFRLRLIPPAIFDSYIERNGFINWIKNGDFTNNLKNSFSDTANLLLNPLFKPQEPLSEKLNKLYDAEWRKNIKGGKDGSDYLDPEIKKYWGGNDERREWCGYFAGYIFSQVGLNNDIVSKMPSSGSLSNWAKKDGGSRIIRPEDIMPGDIIITGNVDTQSPRHVAYAAKVENGVISTYEGNTSGSYADGGRGWGVVTKERPRNSKMSGTYDNEPRGILWGIRMKPEDFNDPSVFGGNSGFSISPISRSINDKSIDIFETAFGNYDTFSDLVNKRQENIMNILGPTAYDRGVAEEYVAGGRIILNDTNGFTEPGIVVDRVMAVDVVNQLRAILSTPPLTLLINPSSLSISYEKVQQYTQRTRGGYVFQSWGENQPVISFSGSIGAFIAGGLGQRSPSGVQFASKRDSASYQNLMNLLTMYRNNGYIFDNVTNVMSPYFVGAVAIEYDQWVYIGNFNTFSWGYDESENQNGRISFDIEFTAIQTFDNHEPSENILPLSTPVGSMDYGYDNRRITDFFSGLALDSEDVESLPPPPTTGIPIESTSEKVEPDVPMEGVSSGKDNFIEEETIELPASKTRAYSFI